MPPQRLCVRAHVFVYVLYSSHNSSCVTRSSTQEKKHVGTVRFSVSVTKVSFKGVFQHFRYRAHQYLLSCPDLHGEMDVMCVSCVELEPGGD